MASSRRILVIAGSDCSGGAGLEADQRVIALHGCYAMTATTALTAQNTQGVADILPTPSAFVIKQIQACIEDIGVDVVKIGMLADTDTVRSVAGFLRDSVTVPIVLDPVMASSTGSQLLPPESVSTVVEELLPITTVLTPNIPEAKLLLGKIDDPNPSTAEDMVALAQELQKLGPRYVLLKGGHFQSHHSEEGKQRILDVLVGACNTLSLEKDFISTKNTHGTGCSLASAIASHIALGEGVPDAVQKACLYVEAGIRSAFPLGKGCGPINHFHSSYTLPFSPGRFIDYVMARKDVGLVWERHPVLTFLHMMADGSLPKSSFKSYMIQYYLFLVQFAQAKTITASKRSSIGEITTAADEVLYIQRQITLHLRLLKGFGVDVSAQDIESIKQSRACLAYTRFILDIAHSSDQLALLIVCLPCLAGYEYLTRRLCLDNSTITGKANPYRLWVQDYITEDYIKIKGVESGAIENNIIFQSPSRVEELVQLYIKASELEVGLWTTTEGNSG